MWLVELYLVKHGQKLLQRHVGGYGVGLAVAAAVENRVAQMTKELDLTADQQKKITAIYTELESKRKEKSERPTREQMRAEFEKIDKQVTAVLTKSQQKKYEEMKQARQNRRQK